MTPISKVSELGRWIHSSLHNLLSMYVEEFEDDDDSDSDDSDQDEDDGSTSSISDQSDESEGENSYVTCEEDDSSSQYVSAVICKSEQVRCDMQSSNEYDEYTYETSFSADCTDDDLEQDDYDSDDPDDSLADITSISSDTVSDLNDSLSISDAYSDSLEGLYCIACRFTEEQLLTLFYNHRLLCPNHKKSDLDGGAK